MNIIKQLSPRQQEAILAVKTQATTLLNVSPRFRLFTLHGTSHLNNLFDLLDILNQGGLKFSSQEVYYLSLAICIHDLGMVVGLKDKEIKFILAGNSVATDPAIVEEKIRELHHEIVDIYLKNNSGFLTALGITPADMGIALDIARCHRKVALEKQHGMIKKLGAILRLIDELDIGPQRAPIEALMNQAVEMDSTSCWHWYKHNIVESWVLGHNVIFKEIHGNKRIEFILAVRPARAESIAYWLHQIRRPIVRALDDDGCRKIIKDNFQVEIELTSSEVRSSAVNVGADLAAIEETAMTGGRKVIILIDDEARKMEDLMMPLSLDYHIMYASSAEDAFAKLSAKGADLAIVDMQIGAFGVWNAQETSDFKKTGMLIVDKIKVDYPSTRVGVLTGTKYDLREMDGRDLAFLLKKPVDPAHFSKTIRHAIEL